MPCTTAGEPASPATTTSTGSVETPGNWAWRTSKPLRDSMEAGRVSTPAEPRSIEKYSEASRRRNPPATTRLTTGRPMTPCVRCPQNPPAPPVPPTAPSAPPPAPAAPVAFLPRNGTRSALTRSPRTPRRAGSRVSAASRAVKTAMIAPTAMLWNRVDGTRKSPPRARMTAMALNSTERVAVEPERPIASILSRPAALSSR